jgi:hypothetical protein
MKDCSILVPKILELAKKKRPIKDDLPEMFLVGVRKYGSNSLLDLYDDLLGFYYRDCIFLGTGTTDPGKYFTLHPEELGVTGVAHMDAGWHENAFKIGFHKASDPRLKHEAFISTGLEDVHRDMDKDGDIDEKDKAGKADGVNFHWGWGMATVGRASAGCQVMQMLADLNKALEYGKLSKQTLFSYLLLLEEEIPEAFIC